MCSSNNNIAKVIKHVIGAKRDAESYKVMVAVRYSYEPGNDEPCRATVEVALPVVPGSLDIPVVLRSSATKLLGWYLTANWGNYSTPHDARTGSTFLVASGWRELEEKIADTLDLIERALQSVVDTNVSALRSKPADRQLEIELTI